MPDPKAKPSIFANKFVLAGSVVAGLVAVFGLAKLVGPKQIWSQACMDTEQAFKDEQAGKREKPGIAHLRYNFKACRKGCDNEDHAGSCSNVAEVYAGGKGIDYDDGVDLELAAQYAERACELEGRSECIMPARYRCRGDAAACEARCRGGAGQDCVSLASTLDDHREDSYEPDRAIELHEQACASGVPASCPRVVDLLCASRPVDCAERCKAGEAALCFALGQHYAQGTGEAGKNPQKATDFKARGCELDPSVSKDCAKILTDAKIEL